jgi:hypothetical protein
LEIAIGDLFEGSSGSSSFKRRSFTTQWAITQTHVCICNLYRAWRAQLEIRSRSMYAGFIIL